MSDRKITPPEWLTVGYVEKAVQEGLKNSDLKVKSCDISPATAAGENFGSVMLRLRLVVQANESEENFSVIVKIPPDSAVMHNNKDGKVLEEKIFRLEIKMITKTIPALNIILRKVYPEQENLGAVCYYQEQNPDITCIFLEDLRQSGFTMANRFTGLDWDHTSLVLRSLAKLHASSLIHVDQDPDAVGLYDGYRWETPVGKNVMKGIYEKPFSVITKIIAKWEDEPKKDIYVKKMQDMENKVVDKFIEIFTRDERKINVICHGDSWVSNMMFRYDEKNKVNGIRFLDFQSSHYNSPVFDLMYFIFSSTQTKFTDVDSLLKVYHETFVTTLDALNYELKKPFTFEVLKNEFREKLFFGLATVLSVLPIIILPATEPIKLDDMLDEGCSETYIKIYDRVEFRNILKVALPYFEQNGVF